MKRLLLFVALLALNTSSSQANDNALGTCPQTLHVFSAVPEITFEAVAPILKEKGYTPVNVEESFMGAQADLTDNHNLYLIVGIATNVSIDNSFTNDRAFAALFVDMGARDKMVSTSQFVNQDRNALAVSELSAKAVENIEPCYSLNL